MQAGFYLSVVQHQKPIGPLDSRLVRKNHRFNEGMVQLILLLLARSKKAPFWGASLKILFRIPTIVE